MVNHLRIFLGQSGWGSSKQQPGVWPISMNAVQENLFMVTSNPPTSSLTRTSNPTFLILVLIGWLASQVTTPPLVALWVELFLTWSHHKQRKLTTTNPPRLESPVADPPRNGMCIHLELCYLNCLLGSPQILPQLHQLPRKSLTWWGGLGKGLNKKVHCLKWLIHQCSMKCKPRKRYWLHFMWHYNALRKTLRSDPEWKPFLKILKELDHKILISTSWKPESSAPETGISVILREDAFQSSPINAFFGGSTRKIFLWEHQDVVAKRPQVHICVSKLKQFFDGYHHHKSHPIFIFFSFNKSRQLIDIFKLCCGLIPSRVWLQ